MHDFGTAVGVQLARGILQVKLHRAFADEGLVRDLLIAEPLSHCKDDVKADELGKGVKAVQDGETVLGKGVGSMVARGLGSTRGVAEHLTDRELEVIRAVAQGLSNKQIAHKTFISESTVKFHLQNASRKLNAHRRAEIVHRASAAGLL